MASAPEMPLKNVSARVETCGSVLGSIARRSWASLPTYTMRSTNGVTVEMPGPARPATAGGVGRLVGDDLEVGAEGELGVDALLLAIGRVEDEDAGREGDGEREHDDRPRRGSGPGRQRSSGQLAARTQDSLEPAGEAAASGHDSLAEPEEQQRAAGPEQQRRKERRQRDRHRGVALDTDDGMDPAAHDPVDDDRGHDREDVSTAAAQS